MIDTPKLRVPARRRQLVLAVTLLVGVTGAAALAVVFLLPRDEIVAIGAWEEAVVSRRDLTRTVEASGSVVTRVEQIVTSPEAATVDTLVVRPGDRVRRGDLLATLSAVELEQELRTQRARLERAEREIRRTAVERSYAERKNALTAERLEREHRDALTAETRARGLVDLGALPASQREEAVAATEQAARALEAERLRVAEEVSLGAIQAEGLGAERDEAAQTVRILEERIRSLQVRSPLDGSVVEVSARAGQYLNAHAVLLTVADTDHPSVELRVPESQVSQVAPGQPVELTVATTQLQGLVESVGILAQGATDTQTGTVAVEVALGEPVPALVAGSTVSAEIAVGVQEGALVLPRGPWLGSGEGRYVYRIEGDHAFRLPAVFGSSRGLEVEVLSGLAEGDRILVSSYQAFRDREVVRLEGRSE